MEKAKRSKTYEPMHDRKKPHDYAERGQGNDSSKHRDKIASPNEPRSKERL
jgi:hypothetical protein